MNKTVAMLGLARKAGRLTFGSDCVKDSVLKKQSKLVVTTSDVSDRTFEKFRKLSESCDVNILKIASTMSDVEAIFRKKVGVMSINDEGFAKKIIELED